MLHTRFNLKAMEVAAALMAMCGGAPSAAIPWPREKYKQDKDDAQAQIDAAAAKRARKAAKHAKKVQA